MAKPPKLGDKLYRSMLRSQSPWRRILEVVDQERADEIDGSDENTEKDLAAYDKIIDILQEEGLIQ